MTLSLTPAQERRLDVLEKKLRANCYDQAQYQLLRGMIQRDANASPTPRLALLDLLSNVVARMQDGTMVYDPNQDSVAALLTRRAPKGPNRRERRHPRRR